MSLGVLTGRPAEEMPGSTGDQLPELLQLHEHVRQAMSGVAQARFLFLCTSHTVNPGKTFPFVCTSHTVLCVGSCVKGVTITHALPWLTVCFYQIYHTRFDEENCVALGYPSQALLLLEPFAKVHDTFSRFISLQLVIPVLRKFTFHIEQLFANFISGT